jgi:tRNA(adenine34) deaminase
MWLSLDPYWQEAFRLAWQSFCNGTIPIGCVIVNDQGEVVARGRNAIFDTSSTHPLAGTVMAHAEMMALSQLKEKEHPNIRTYTLYTTLEPCPMCFGTLVMMHIRHVKYAGRDGVAGSIALKSATPYLAKKAITTELASPTLEVFQLALITAFELKRQHQRQAELLQLWRAHCPVGVDIGIKLTQEGYFTTAVRDGYGVEDIFRRVHRELTVAV